MLKLQTEMRNNPTKVIISEFTKEEINQMRHILINSEFDEPLPNFFNDLLVELTNWKE